MKTKNKVFLCLIVIIIFIYTYVNNSLVNVDPYYKYQWGLKNNNDFYVSKNEIRSNNKVRYFDEEELYFVFPKKGEYELTKYDSMHSKGIDINYYEINEFSFENEVIVAIIDTGIDLNHEDFLGKIWSNDLEIPNNNIDDDKNGYVDDVHGYNFLDNTSTIYTDEIIDGHATHIAGIIAARKNNGIGISGLCGDFVKIMSLKVLGTDGNGDVKDLVRAINYAHDNGAKICNISLGTRTYDKALDEVIKKYDDMIFVVAAGNGSNFIGYDINVKEVYPGSFDYDNVITVSNIGFDGDRYESANYGKLVTVFAPGTYIISTLPKNKYGFLTGSSIATPYVTSVVAMMMSINKDIDIKSIKKIIIDTATKYDILENLCKAGGVLNASEAIKMASTK